jgi:hypothetical protein
MGEKINEENGDCWKQDQVQEEGIAKRTESWRTGGVAQVEECIFCKYNALSSNPSPTKSERK